eukprot:TRINITY_DN28386_c0_g1_i1.p2 TRINITY_DN28386_c0_g1~~TRINITY_DN28386_c0_g1_i1.p2  ORF type:complete len:146 (+),score=57.87 TRINITY_DN28386_c0_g1_i1:153-590(+)
MCIRDRVSTQSTGAGPTTMAVPFNLEGEFDSFSKELLGEYDAPDDDEDENKKQETEDTGPAFMFFDFRRGRDKFPQNVELMDADAAAEEMESTKTELEKEAEKKADKDKDKDDGGADLLTGGTGMQGGMGGMGCLLYTSPSPRDS